MPTEIQHSQLRCEAAGGEEGEGGEAPLMKSRDPYLAGGEIYYITLNYIILYYTILYYILLYYIILYYIILYYSIL